MTHTTNRSSPPAEPKCEPNPILSCVCSRGTKCCPIDHRPPVEPKCGRCGHDSHGKRCYEINSVTQTECFCDGADWPADAYHPPATPEPAEEDLFVPPDPTAEYREGDIDKFFGCMAHTASAIDTEDAKALEDRAKHFWREETYAEELPHKRLARFAQAEIERQTPAIIERKFAEVEKLAQEMFVDYSANGENEPEIQDWTAFVYTAMQAVKARREGGEGKYD